MKSAEPKLYPCAECGALRSKDEGGTVFTVCDDCWTRRTPHRSRGGEPDALREVCEKRRTELLGTTSEQRKETNGYAFLHAPRVADSRNCICPALREAQREQMERDVEIAKQKADRAYCDSLDNFQEVPCLGWEQKIKEGRFGGVEMIAHEMANRLMGAHIGGHAIVKEIRRRFLGEK